MPTSKKKENGDTVSSQKICVTVREDFLEMAIHAYRKEVVLKNRKLNLSACIDHIFKEYLLIMDKQYRSELNEMGEDSMVTMSMDKFRQGGF